MKKIQLITSYWVFNLMIIMGIGNSSCQQQPTALELQEMDVFLTLTDGSKKLAKDNNGWEAFATDAEVIAIDADVTYQIMDGFGFAVTGGSATHLMAMSQSARQKLLQELFGRGPGQMGLSMIRISIGASDLDAEVFSYVDTPDQSLNSFSLGRDTVTLIPLLKEILMINPDLGIMASPWSPPVWMKSNQRSIGGSLLPEYYRLYADYFVKYLQTMESSGITIDWITPQNEPLHDGNNPSLYMTAAEQTTFIKEGLGPAFEAAALSTRILVYDHNADRPDYPLTILDDPEAKKYVYGSAFHLYGGQVAALGQVHDQHPDRHIYFTEQWYGAPGDFGGDFSWHVREVVIGAVNNWSKGVIEWNLTSNPTLTPHTPGGCTQCLGAITLDGDQITRNAGYYAIGHAAAFVPPGSQRINTTNVVDCSQVAFLTPDDDVVLIVQNNSDKNKRINVIQGSVSGSYGLAEGAVATLRWKRSN